MKNQAESEGRVFSFEKFRCFYKRLEIAVARPGAGVKGDKRMARVSGLNCLWPALILLSAVAVGLVTLVFPATVIRPVMVMWFLFVCPGMAVVRFLQLAETVVEWMIALALSFTIDAIVAAILLYAGWWSPARILAILIGFCIIGAMIQVCVLTTVLAALPLKLMHVVRSKRQYISGKHVE